MPIKRYKPEQIVTMLRQIEVSIANGKTHPKPAKKPRSQSKRSTAGGRNTAVENGPGQTAKRTGKRERQVEATSGGALIGQADPEGYCRGKLLSPERRRCAVEHAREQYEVSERRACRVVRQWRGTQRYFAAAAYGRRSADAGDPGPGGAVWAVRLSAHHGVGYRMRVACKQGSSAADSGDAKG